MGVVIYIKGEIRIPKSKGVKKTIVKIKRILKQFGYEEVMNNWWDSKEDEINFIGLEGTASVTICVRKKYIIVNTLVNTSRNYINLDKDHVRYVLEKIASVCGVKRKVNVRVITHA